MSDSDTYVCTPHVLACPGVGGKEALFVVLTARDRLVVDHQARREHLV